MSSTTEELRLKLGALAAADVAETTWQPRLIRLERAADREELASLLDAGRVLCVHDTLAAQLQELMAVRVPSKKGRPAELAEMARELLGAGSAETYGTWVFYPWSGRLVHVLPDEAFFELRTARNHYKITPAEQRVLASKAIGVVGLPVGG